MNTSSRPFRSLLASIVPCRGRCETGSTPRFGGEIYRSQLKERQMRGDLGDPERRIRLHSRRLSGYGLRRLVRGCRGVARRCGCGLCWTRPSCCCCGSACRLVRRPVAGARGLGSGDARARLLLHAAALYAEARLRPHPSPDGRSRCSPRSSPPPAQRDDARSDHCSTHAIELEIRVHQRTAELQQEQRAAAVQRSWNAGARKPSWKTWPAG